MNLATIFDMDGVLIDSQPLHYEVQLQVLKACGHDATLSTVAPYSGMSTPDLWNKAKEDLGLTQEPEELIKMAEQFMLDLFANTNLQPIEGIPTLLEGIKAMGIKLGVASSSPPELIKMVLNKIGIADRFDIIVSGEDVAEGKPAPDIYLAAAEKAGVTPNMCIAIEDAPVGIAAAKNAGCVCIAFSNPNTLGQNFDRADYTVHRFDDCFPIIKTLFFRSVTGSLI